MKISKKDALMWFRFFAELPEDEPLMPHQQELAWAVISQIETAVDARHKELMAQIHKDEEQKRYLQLKAMQYSSVTRRNFPRDARPA